MRRLSILLTIVAVLLSSGTAKADDKSDLQLRVRINYVMSSIGLPPESGDVYYLTIKDGKLKTFLPFIGTSDSAGYGSGYDPSIDVDAEMEDYSEKVNKKKNEKEIVFYCIDANNLKWKVTLTIYEGETVTATFFNSSRSMMTYRGDIWTPEE